jgi:uncharacterized protein YdeI (YjbR/CyaY-like superfamily)
VSKSYKIDDYIASSAEFAQPILNKLRSLIHQANPDIEETIKWGMPNFEYKGIVCHIAAFKNHCAFGFMKYKLMQGLEGGGMNSFGKIKSVEDLPDDEVVLMCIKEAIDLNEKGVKLPKSTKEKKELIIPGYFTEALKGNPKAEEVFNGFLYSNKKEYVEWITEAKRETTRENRIVQMLEWLKEGKRKNWKYENC